MKLHRRIALLVLYSTFFCPALYGEIRFSPAAGVSPFDVAKTAVALGTYAVTAIKGPGLGCLRTKSMFKLSSTTIAAARFTVKERKKLAKLTAVQWADYMRSGRHGARAFQMYSLYQFSTHLHYLKTFTDYEDQMLNIGCFGVNPEDGEWAVNEARARWREHLEGDLGAPLADRIYTIITREQERITNERAARVRRGQLKNKRAFTRTRNTFAEQRVRATQQLERGDRSVVSKTYTLNAPSVLLMKELGIDPACYAQITGTIVQHQNHAEIMFLVDEFGRQHRNATLKPLSRTMCGFVDAACECNRENNTDGASAVIDFCWNVLEYAHAVVGGVGDGVLNVANTVVHPVNTLESAALSLKHAGTFLATIVGDAVRYGAAATQYEIGASGTVQYNGNTSRAWEQSAQKCADIADALHTMKEMVGNASGPERVRMLTAAGTEFWVSGKVYGALLKSSGALFARARQQATTLAQEIRQTVFAEQAVASAQGIELRMAAESTSLLERTAGASDFVNGARSVELSALTMPGAQDCWCMSEKGCVIKGRYYTKHALERMAPATRLVKEELEKRALAKGFQKGSEKFIQYVDARNIPPMVVEGVIQTVSPIPGKLANTFNYISENLKVVINDRGDVITVFRQ